MEKETIKVRDVLAKAASVLSIEPTEEFLASCVRTFCAVEAELAMDHFPILAEEELPVKNREIHYSDFSYSPYKLLRVASTSGEELLYRAHSPYLKVDTEDSKVIVKYSFVPPLKELDGKSEYSSAEMFNVLLEGVISEIALIKGDYATASTHSKKYESLIKEIKRGRV